jgi:hypothetical protein
MQTSKYLIDPPNPRSLSPEEGKGSRYASIVTCPRNGGRCHKVTAGGITP